MIGRNCQGLSEGNREHQQSNSHTSAHSIALKFTNVAEKSAADVLSQSGPLHFDARFA
jgi:hypothetical protein